MSSNLHLYASFPNFFILTNCCCRKKQSLADCNPPSLFYFFTFASFTWSDRHAVLDALSFGRWSKLPAHCSTSQMVSLYHSWSACVCHGRQYLGQVLLIGRSYHQHVVVVLRHVPRRDLYQWIVICYIISFFLIWSDVGLPLPHLVWLLLPSRLWND